MRDNRVSIAWEFHASSVLPRLGTAAGVDLMFPVDLSRDLVRQFEFIDGWILSRFLGRALLAWLRSLPNGRTRRSLGTTTNFASRLQSSHAPPPKAHRAIWRSKLRLPRMSRSAASWASRRGNPVPSGHTSPPASAGEDRNSFPAFTDDPLVPESTVVKTAHVMELRLRIHDIRKRLDLPAFAWTDPAPALALGRREPRTSRRCARRLTKRSTPANRANPPIPIPPWPRAIRSRPFTSPSCDLPF